MIAQDQAVAPGGTERLVEDQLHQARLARRDRPPNEDRDPARQMRGAEMHMHRREMPERPVLGGENPDPGIDAPARPVGGGGEQPVAAAERDLLEVRAGNVERRALPRRRRFRLPPFGMDGADAHVDPLGREDKHVAALHLAREHRPGDHQAGAGDGEAAVDGETEVAVRQPRRQGLGGVLEMGAQFRHAGAGHRR